MKAALFAVLAVGAGVLLWYGITMGSAVRSCGQAYQGKIDQERVRAAAAVSGGGNRVYCSVSYDLIVSWEECMTRARVTGVPPFIAAQLRPVVTAVLTLMGDRSSELTVLKQEHDEECKEDIDLMFFPPEPLR